MRTLKRLTLMAATALATQVYAGQFYVAKLDSIAKSYVKSVNIPGFEELNKNRGEWIIIPAGSYKGQVECVVDGTDVTVDIKLEVQDDPKVYRQFIADGGCGFMVINQD